MKKMAELEAPNIETRVARLREELDSSPAGRETLQTLVPAHIFRTDENIVDFSDWQQWSQWRESA
jgi:hypothetical protein